MTLKVFELVKSVLGESYNQIPGTDSEKDLLIKKKLSNLRSVYGKILRGDAGPNFGDPVIRFAYVFNYVTSHANVVCEMIDRHKDLRELFDREVVKIACIGGGPGSELVGVLKFCSDLESVPKLKFYLIDGEPSWSESWSDVDDKISELSEMNVSTYFHVIDVTRIDIWNKFHKYLSYDLFVFSFFFSEIYHLQNKSQEYFEFLFKNAAEGSLFLFIDILDQKNRPGSWFMSLCAENGVSVINELNLDTRLPSEEEKTDLGEYYTKFGSPKLTGQNKFILARKIR